MKKRMTILLIALAVVFGGLIAFNLIRSFLIQRYFSHFEPPAVTVSSVKAKTINWQPSIEAVGNFTAINGVDVTSESSGIVVKINFQSGQYIEKNQPLIDIDDSLEQATLKFNLAELALKDVNHKRQSDLLKRNAAATSTVDEARANLDQAKANVEKTEVEIRHKHITAPFKGQLGIRQVDIGEFINPGQNPIVTLQSLDPLFLEFYLPEQLFKKIRINQPITFSVDGFAGVNFEGIITAINSKVDVNTHNILIQATLPNCPSEAFKNLEQSRLVKVKKQNQGLPPIIVCDSQLNSKNKIDHFTFLPGMFASIEIPQPAIADTVVLPSTAISYSLYGNSVFIINKDKKDEQGKDTYTVSRSFVTTGEQRGNYIVIKKGVLPNQEVVSSGELKLQNGTRVTINNSVKLDESLNPKDLDQ